MHYSPGRINSYKYIAVIFTCFMLCLVNTSPRASDSTRGEASHLILPASESSKNGDEASELATKILLLTPNKLLGAGGYRIGIQSFAFDERFHNIYTLQLNGATAGNQSTINRLPLYGPTNRDTIAYSTPVSRDVGHQGLGIEYPARGGVRLWTTAHRDFRQVVRYSYADGLPLANVEMYRLFGNDFRARSSSTPTISHDQKYLVAIGMRKNSSVITVRVWRLVDLVEGGPGNYSNSWLYEWDAKQLADSVHPVQGTASDGKTVWLVAGNNDIHVPKRLQAYTLRGALMSSDDDFKIGRVQALLDGSGSVYEPEGLALLYHGGDLALCVGILSGDLGQRFTRIYRINNIGGARSL